ncbi:AzlC family ABC transporter permease [uncultured Cohaesibacter sp.]|uniref:AzlC family ABC transporter permease n=1 Tax=uncultured Cohaesibacter sp. TaxID=1002546 RepID=UPI0029C7B844|nr:AzlC family ABC transporter permease [uncultured Cohaesibacter sp.]
MTGKRLPDDSMTPWLLFLEGMKRGLPIVITAGPFGALFGALAVDGGMATHEAVLMSATIFAGASQLVGLNLFGHNIPAWIVVLSIFAVNFRHILYSASLGRHISGWSAMRQYFGFFFLVDPAYAETERRVEQGEDIQFSWYMGLAFVVYVGWVVMTWLGTIFGNFLEDSHRWGIDFLLPVYFMALLMGFRKRPLWLPIVAVSAAASILASETVGSPWHVSIGAAVGILTAAFFAPIPKRSEAAEDKEGLH